MTNDGSFVVNGFNRAKPFSSFLPGIAGVWGVPLWAYYVNRGQGIATFGTQDKDHAIMPFESAKLHQHRVSLEGFRTFLKVHGPGGEWMFDEPFQRSTSAYETGNRMTCRPHALELVEYNHTLGLQVEVSYTTVCNQPFAALVRKVVIRNKGTNPLDVELLDGAPRILPYGVPFHMQQVLPFITEGYLQVRNLEANVPFLNLKAQASDSSETAQLESGNFFFGFSPQETAKLLPAIIDIERIFGPTGDLVRPYVFEGNAFDPYVEQNRHCQTCCGFLYDTFSVDPEDVRDIVSVYGAADRLNDLSTIISRVRTEDFFEENMEAAGHEVHAVMDRFCVHSASPRLNNYVRQTYLDNVLRGGLPVTLGTEARKHVFHVYSRKHGDLERDYNMFELAATPWSQGNGNFRDVNQNRRHDVWFNPDVDDSNVRFFFNLLQPDGFNPLVCRGVQFKVNDRDALTSLLEEGVVSSDIENVRAYLSGPFAPGELFMFLRREGIELRIDRETFLNRLAAVSEKIELAAFETGYWTDHWLYNFDQLRSFDAIFPDRLRQLLVEDTSFTYRDTDVRVLPRADKYVLYDENKVWHIDSITTDPQKTALIEDRRERAYCVRTANGEGRIYTTCLLQKILCLFVNKMASISPSGIGMDMDAGRPGWHDSINGIPGALGASTSEVYHLIRAMDWTRRALDRCGLSGDDVLSVPVELHTFMNAVRDALSTYADSGAEDRDFVYWDRTGELKEAFRAATHFGFDGEEKQVPYAQLADWLTLARNHLAGLLPRAVDSATGLPYTYVTHNVLDYDILTERDPNSGAETTKRHPRGFPCVRIKKVEPHFLPLFLEAPTHYLRTEPGSEEARRVWQAVRQSPLYDEPLGMYLVGDSVQGESKDVGRIWAWPPGWFENENVFLHIEHKYLLALLHAGAYEEFFTDLQNCLLPCQDMDRLGRNPLENASFLVSSRHPRPDYHGRGFLPRTSGTTAEVLEIMLTMAFGKTPFRATEAGVVIEFQPVLPAWLFTGTASERAFLRADGSKFAADLPAGTFSATFLAHTLVVFHNPDRKNTFGPDAATVQSYRLTFANGEEVLHEEKVLPPNLAEAVRNRQVDRIDVVLD